MFGSIRGATTPKQRPHPPQNFTAASTTLWAVGLGGVSSAQERFGVESRPESQVRELASTTRIRDRRPPPRDPLPTRINRRTKSHMSAQRGQSAGVSRTTLAGSTASGSQPCHHGMTGEVVDLSATMVLTLDEPQRLARHNTLPV